MTGGDIEKCATCGTGEPLFSGVSLCKNCARKVAIGTAFSVRQKAHEALDRGLGGLLSMIGRAFTPKDTTDTKQEGVDGSQ